MIDCIFTLDYEIYGNGTGSLQQLVLDPGQRLLEIFKKWDARLVNYVEVSEFEQIKAKASDPAIGQVEEQIRQYRQAGHEIALHLHPQWYNARYEQGNWILDSSEYNLCKLSRTRIDEILIQALSYMRQVLCEPHYTPLSFRAGNWLFQPTATAATVMAEHGIRIDSSVFKGGVQHIHGLDYRRSQKNGYYWPFRNDANVPDTTGSWVEVPIYSKMVPLWKMRTSKRMAFSGGMGMGGKNFSAKWSRVRDLMRFLYPLKFDFCRMTLEEMTLMMDEVIAIDKKSPETYRPIVAIGHTKDLSDPESVDQFLAYLRDKKIPVATFQDIYSKLAPGKKAGSSTQLATQHS